MSVIKIEDVAHVRFSAPDAEAMKAFLVDFGLTPFVGANGDLYARGTGMAPFVHATSPGEPAFLALGLRASSVADLERLAASENVEMKPFDAPGGGYVVKLTDPDGFRVEVVAGQTPAEPLPLPDNPPHNDAYAQPRMREALRLARGASTVVRLGHSVLEVTDFRRSETWYKSRFGFITSDEIEAGPGFSIAAFMRCDRGDTPTDHHTLFLLQGPGAPRFHHAAFEVAGLDDLMCGHYHLKQAGRDAAWGIGRHVLGSQIFDYWRDPWGHELEHWTDGDQFAVADGSRVTPLQELLDVQWGPHHPSMQAK
ncbi:MAG: VOC family protein [Hyphomonadaceae bacterium]|nr:VOC family protein [Hyphomonadaceae bacterium]